MKKLIILILIFFDLGAFSSDSDLWKEGVAIPPGGRDNPYGWSEEVLKVKKRNGQIHALSYPVEVTGVLAPYYPIKDFFETKEGHPLRNFLKLFFQSLSQFRSFNDVFLWVGMHEYPKPGEQKGQYEIPYPGGIRPDYPMGVTLIQRRGSTGFTISCAECHSSQLFDKKILGMTNRFPRANMFFFLGKKGSSIVHENMLDRFFGANQSDVENYSELKKNLKSVGVKIPAQLGLDTSLAQVALSLSRRNEDDYATKNPEFEKKPRADLLDKHHSESKPAVWWNLKYKNKWLSDGSVVSGNPVFTNFLWNEIGRGVDLFELERWLLENEEKVQELTTAVFSTEAPPISDFFEPHLISEIRAKKGEKLFLSSCAKCHGVYQKKWSEENADKNSWKERMKTLKVIYHTNTPVIDVGTDPSRYQGMISLAEKLNPLAISKENGTKILPHKGYVPPPLVGIWARYPYFHNNSVPTLCDVLTSSELRPKKYWAGPQLDKQRDFDFECNGYVSGKSIPQAWKKNRENRFNTKKSGTSNQGHDQGIFIINGKEIFSKEDKRNLIQFLQTL